jgi:hypothetical protein
VGSFIYELGSGQWNIAALRLLLEEVLPQQKNFDRFAVAHDFPIIGRKRMLIDARQIDASDGQRRVILLAFDDVTSHAAS